MIVLDEKLPKKKQINVSIPEMVNEKIDRYISENKLTLERMGLRSKAQVVAAILENGMIGFDKIVKAAKAAIEH